MPKPNPNRIHGQPSPEPSPPPSQGARDAPTDTTDWIEVGHQEAESQRRHGDVIPATHGNAPGGRRPKPPRTGA
jgi:hypothetical protein